VALSVALLVALLVAEASPQTAPFATTVVPERATELVTV